MGDLCGGHRPAGGGAARLRQGVAQDTAPCTPDGEGTDEAGDAVSKLNALKQRFMQVTEFSEECARVDGAYALVEALVRVRTATKLTRAEVARRLEALGVDRGKEPAHRRGGVDTGLRRCRRSRRPMRSGTR